MQATSASDMSHCLLNMNMPLAWLQLWLAPSRCLGHCGVCSLSLLLVIKHIQPCKKACASGVGDGRTPKCVLLNAPCVTKAMVDSITMFEDLSSGLQRPHPSQLIHLKGAFSSSIESNEKCGWLGKTCLQS